jgi:hypothetical protein
VGTFEERIDRRHLGRLLAALAAGAGLVAAGGRRETAARQRRGRNETTVVTGGTNTGQSQTNGPVRGDNVHSTVHGEVVVGEDG